MAPGLETCPVTPPDGYSLKAKESTEESSQGWYTRLTIHFAP